MVEDNPTDAELILHELRKAGIDFRETVVQKIEAFTRQLRTESYDLVLSDYQLPEGTGMDVLRRLQREEKDIPFILVTGALGEETAVECIKNGATDCVLKDGLVRLPLAIRRALEAKALSEERALLEEQFLQAQKMEAVGRLAGGVAHDFNNMLQIILSHCEYVLDDPHSPERVREGSEEIKKAAQRAASLTRQLLAFSRKQRLEPRVFDLNASVAPLAKLLGRVLGEDIEITTSLDPDLGSVEADPQQMEMVIMNLAVNARDAMPQGGRLAIRTENVDGSRCCPPRNAFEAPGSCVMLSIADTGCGIDEETRAHIFEPFFTTKDAGKGTGLGLSVVYGIVKQSGGRVEVQSESGVGTTFRIYLPRAEESGAAESRPGALDAPRGEETVLVVEDDPSLRWLVAKLLRAWGYDVLEAQDGPEALRIAEGYGEPIALLVTDVLMPGMSGLQLADQMIARWPELKVLYMTGFTHEEMMPLGISDPAKALIQKPFTRAALALKIREVLANKKPA